MPPFGNVDAEIISMRSSSFFKDDTLDCFREEGVRPEDLKLILGLMTAESVPMDLVANIRDLFDKTSELETQVVKKENDPILKRAINNSIGLELTGIVDQLEDLFDSQGDTKLVLSGLINSSVKRSFQFLERIESSLDLPENEKLEHSLRDVLAVGPDEQEKAIRVSLLSSSLSFEFMSGPIVMRRLDADSSDKLPLSVTVTPFFYLQASDILERGDMLQPYKFCHAKIDLCHHNKWLSSSGSGVIGETLVQVSLTPENDIKIGKNGCAWKKDGRDSSKLRVMEVRAVQKNAFPRTTQTKVDDLFISSIYGLSGLVVTMKLRTYRSIKDEAPEMDIQLVLEPPLSDQVDHLSIKRVYSSDPIRSTVYE